ncbi:TrmH family RNA methyltransferase [Aestuariimicrobium sp. T2.26MG-19.2B]|uniref:TrmH family RNA methyltransferase n=1 Tax=Aestuariimicrobium sp. T2.26MG-19.2B TaxID=3040679 RepID=UPI00247792D5|nr:RNA methyltransferase [Aestuariimicrobium sp. T2.26MG-19.2B]CAI9399013.1 23S rRNA (guanosine-2'-O-)-methyltransferase RlmB [Aestuariimicrobium sp. T2.26MG-19.2B]
MATYQELTDPDDPRLADYVSLRDTQLRKSLEAANGFYIAEGHKIIRRAIESGHHPRSVVLAPRWIEGLRDVLDPIDVPVHVVTEALAEQVTGFHVHRGALAAIERPTGHDDLAALLHQVQWGAGPRSRIAVLEDLVDHSNVGAAFRSAVALGVDAVVVTPRCADPWYRRSIKVSMGAVFQVPWVRADPWPSGITQLKEAGYFVAGMSLGEGSISLDELVAQDHSRLVMIFGNEGHGLTPATDALIDARVTIPMMGGIDSLNVAASSAVAFYATR